MTNAPHAVDDANLRAVGSLEAIRTYSWSTRLVAGERAALAQVQEEARDRPILDLGIGTGRTVRPLMDISQDYRGIDYSPVMLAAAKVRHPTARLEQGDARELVDVPDDSVFLAVFSCGGIGMVSHEDRLRILDSVYRVLQPGGYFIFSIHNQDSAAHTAGFRFPPIELSRNPLRLVVRAWRFGYTTVRRAWNRIRLLGHEMRTPEYSLINDAYHDHGTLIYYTTLGTQRSQLAEKGFETDFQAFSEGGAPVSPGAIDTSLVLTARKPRSA